MEGQEKKEADLGGGCSIIRQEMMASTKLTVVTMVRNLEDRGTPRGRTDRT